MFNIHIFSICSPVTDDFEHLENKTSPLRHLKGGISDLLVLEIFLAGSGAG